jgi:predicted Zn-dependent protease
VYESTFPDANRDQILARIVDGINAWAVSTSNQIGSLIRVGSPGEADFVIVGQDSHGEWAAQVTHSGGNPFLHGGRIAFDRQTVIALFAREPSQILSALAAHEMGHLLGILGHPAMEGVLMHNPLQSLRPTTEDINTMSDAYCRL